MTYLARLGKISGPFSAQEFRSLQETGQIDQYRWIWDESKQVWKALDPAPTSKPQSEKPIMVSTKGLQVLVFDQVHILAGQLDQVTETGCVVRPSGKNRAPAFGSRSPVRLNFLNPKSGEQMNVDAELFGIERISDELIYRIRWNQLPEILEK